MEAQHTPEEFAAVAAERDALRKFKDWAHAYLDNLGVPRDPQPEHTARHGCRISGRMNYLVRQRDDLLAACEAAVEKLSVFDPAAEILRAAVHKAKGGGT